MVRRRGMRIKNADDLERFAKRYSPEKVYTNIQTKNQQEFYFTFGVTDLGKKICLGPFMSHGDADVRLSELDFGEVFTLKTKDLAKATRIIKAQLMSRGESPDEALARHKHSL